MRFPYHFTWSGPFLWTQTLPSSDQLVGIPWWVWLVILLVLLFLLFAGLFGQGDPEYLYPSTQQNSPEEAYNQVSSGTELESVVNIGSTATEDPKPTATKPQEIQSAKEIADD
ncbi:MAG: hypothetical protein WA996_08060 [Candidatus Promineifilaceae bacterium]